MDRLVYFEHTHDVHAAIAREKEIKRWVRAKKVALVESVNPAWDDLYDSIASIPAGLSLDERSGASTDPK